jgi:hypothetical protein
MYCSQVFIFEEGKCERQIKKNSLGTNIFCKFRFSYRFDEILIQYFANFQYVSFSQVL